MKRLMSVLLICVFVMSFAASAFADKYVVSTKKDPLNVRSICQPEKIYGGIRKGKTVNVLSTDKYWAYIKYDGHLRKVFKSYLTRVGNKTTNTSSKSTVSKRRNKPVYREPVSFNVASKIYVVKASVKSCINARTSKSTKAHSLGKLYPGDLVYVVNTGYKWTRVVYNNQYAYVLTNLIEESGVNLPDEGTLYTVAVKNGTTLNVRAEGNAEAKILRKIPNKAYVKVLEEGEEWSKVYYENDAVGYVMKDFITPVEGGT